LDNLLDAVPLATRRDMRIQMDGAGPHYAIPVRQWFNNNYPNKWIGRGGPTPWPARSLDFNPIDFFLWGHLKNIVYSTVSETVEELQDRIFDAANTVGENSLMRIPRSLGTRANACLNANGHVFEHLL
jgi:hypothetical protein